MSAGTVTRLDVRPGDQVAAGTVLAVVSTGSTDDGSTDATGSTADGPTDATGSTHDTSQHDQETP